MAASLQSSSLQSVNEKTAKRKPKRRRKRRIAELPASLQALQSDDEKTTAKVIGVSPKTMQAWRIAETGPPFIKLGDRPKVDLGRGGGARPKGKISPHRPELQAVRDCRRV